MSVLSADYPCHSFTTTPSGGNDSDGDLGEVLRHFRQPACRLGVDDVVESLFKTYKSCSERNWDGYDSNPISYRAFIEAERFVKLLPSSFHIPEIVPEPAGDIGLEWYNEKQHTFVISFSGNNIITYAGIYGKDNKTHGTEFFANSLPLRIVRNIQDLYQ